MRRQPDYRLYVITERWGGRTHLEVVRAAVRGGATAIQLREKELPPAAVADEARAIAELCQGAGVTFIVNDWVDQARAWGADGVHLGETDADPEAARETLGREALLGLSATRLEAVAGLCARADYLGAGPVLATATKPDAAAAFGMEGLRQMVQAATVPVVAIGGMNAEVVPQVMRAGAAGVAVISAVTRAADMEDAVRRMRQAIEESEAAS